MQSMATPPRREKRVRLLRTMATASSATVSIHLDARSTESRDFVGQIRASQNEAAANRQNKRDHTAARD